MNYQCAKCGRELVWNETLSFCPFCGHAYASVTAPQTVTQRIVIGADGERTVQEKYWQKSQQEMKNAIRKIRYSLPHFREERPDSDNWQCIPKQYDAKEMDVNDFFVLRRASSTAEFRVKLCRYLDTLRQSFEIKSGILKRLCQDTEEHPLHEGKKHMPGGLDFSAFEDEFSIQIDQETAYIDNQCLKLAKELGCINATTLAPSMRYAPESDDWSDSSAENDDLAILSESVPAYKELLNVLIDIRNVLIKIVDENSTFILSDLRRVRKCEAEEEEKYIPACTIQQLKKLSQEDYDPIFGQSSDELIGVFAEAVFQCSCFVNELPCYWDLLDRHPYENILVFKVLLDKYKLRCLLQYLSSWSAALEQELDRAYQEQRLDMIALSQKLEQFSEEIPN